MKEILIASQPVWLIIFSDQIVPLDNSKKKHLQILHCDFDGGHWIACHYDTKIVIIYDSYEGSRNANIQNSNEEFLWTDYFPFMTFRIQ